LPPYAPLSIGGDNGLSSAEPRFFPNRAAICAGRREATRGGKKLSRAILRRALARDVRLRVVHAADLTGIRGILVHAISPEAESFYLTLGGSPLESPTFMATLDDILASCV
jgi:hypothetical protein